MLTDKKIEELLAVIEAYEEAKAQLMALLNAIALETSAEPAAVAKPEKKTRPGRRGGRRPKAAAGNGGQSRWFPKLEVQCAACRRIIKGAKRIGDQLYPYQHDNAAGSPCSGVDKPVLEVESQAGAGTGTGGD